MPHTTQRSIDRIRVSVPARLTWRDASGAMRFASVTTRDVSESGAFVQADARVAIPLYRIVHLQLERDATGNEAIPERLRTGRVLSAVWRVGPSRRATGTPEGYALRFLVEPHHPAEPTAKPRMQVAS